MPNDLVVGNAAAIPAAETLESSFRSSIGRLNSAEIAIVKKQMDELQAGVERMAAYLGVMHLLKGQ